ncbi:MAG: transcriptional repressor [Desulfobacterales bacterium]
MEKEISSSRTVRMTKQRRIILEELRRLDSHPSAEELCEAVRERLPRISLATVYRNLEVLSELGEIQKLELGGTQKRFDWDPRKHYHIRCINCDRVDNARMGFMENVEQSLSASTDFKVMDHRLEFLGLCPACLEKALERESLGQKVGR